MSRVPSHVLRTAVALDDVRLLYVPVPKAGCTALLWALAELAGLSERDFARSRKLEVTRSLAVHDLFVWGPSLTLEERGSEELEWILHSPDWLRFTVVREPLRRLWSAWVSKLLVREPRFVAMFGDEEWFPTPPSSSEDVLRSFRRFVSALSEQDPAWHDPHWSPQVDLLGTTELAYGHVGRLERVAETLDVLGERVREHGRELPSLPSENRSLLPYVPGVFDHAAHVAGVRFTARDREAFGYEDPQEDPDGPGEAWHAAVSASIPAIRGLIERHQRVGDLHVAVRPADGAPV